MRVLRRGICVGARGGGEWRRRLLGLGEGGVGGLRLVVVAKGLVRARLLVGEPMMRMIFEGLEAVVVVAVGARRGWEGDAEAAVVEMVRRYDLTTLSSDSHARLPSMMSRHCHDVNGTVQSECCFEYGLGVCLPLAEGSAADLETDLLAVAPVAHAHTLLHAPWLLPAAFRAL